MHILKSLVREIVLFINKSKILVLLKIPVYYTSKFKFFIYFLSLLDDDTLSCVGVQDVPVQLCMTQLSKFFLIYHSL
jgi:hypothetical protein